MKGKAIKQYSINKNEMKEVMGKLRNSLEKIPENDIFWKRTGLEKNKSLSKIEKMLIELEDK